MNSGLYFTVTLVALAWLSAGTCRADTTTMKTGTSMTTAANMTTANANMTTANANMTTANANMTTANNNVTATASTTAAPPLVANNTVSALETPVNNSGCRSVQLCAAQPADCNPGTGSCTLLGTRQKSGNNFEFILAGESSGYLATVVSFDGTLDGGATAFVCFNQSGSVAFTGASLNNSQLTRQNVSANNVRGRLTDTQIQCIFDATVRSDARVSGATLGVVSGTVSGNSFGPANPIIKTAPLDLTNPNQTVVNKANAATTSSPNVTTMTTTNTTTMTTTMTTTNTTTMTTTNTTNNAMSFRQTLIQALMISAGVMGLTML